jgi:hypothetical protein
VPRGQSDGSLRPYLGKQSLFILRTIRNIQNAERNMSKETVIFMFTILISVCG